MLSDHDVARLARDEGLGDYAEDLVSRLRAGWRLDAAGVGPARVGGEPDLAPDEVWPLNERGVPMVFLAQVDCSSLPPIEPPWDRASADWAHGGGLLRLFADFMDNPFEGEAAIAVSCDPAGPLARRPAPGVPDPWPPGGPEDDLEAGERFHVLPETTVACVPFLTVPETHPSLHAEFDQFDEQADRYEQFRYRLRVDGARIDESSELEPWSVSHLLGEAQSIQHDVRLAGAGTYGYEEFARHSGVAYDETLADTGAWQVLLALHMDETLRLEILDGGAMHVLAPSVDLAEGRFDRLVADIDSG